MDFDPVIEGYLAGSFPKLTPLIEFQFDIPQRLWLGRGTLTSGAKDWLGIQRLLTIDGLDQATTLETSDMTFTLSGADQIMEPLFPVAAAEDRSGYVNKIVVVYLQFMDDDFLPIAAPWAIKAGICGTMEITRSYVEGEGMVRTITLPAKNMFFGRGVAPNANWSDRDQQTRHPGDLGLSFLTGSQTFTFPEPWR